MTTALVKQDQTAVAPVRSLEELKSTAAMVVAAGLAPRGMTPEQLTITMLKGQEMGMGPMEAMESFYVVNGAVGSMTHQLVNRLRAAGHDYAINESTMERCTITLYRRNGAKHTHTLTFAECEAAGYNKTREGTKPTWRGAGQRWMVAYRTISSAIKLYCPEVLHRSHQAPVEPSERVEPSDLASAWYAYTRQLLETDGLDSTLDLVRQIADSLARDAEEGAQMDALDSEVVDAEYEAVEDEAEEAPPASPTAMGTTAPEPLPSRPYPPEVLKRGIASRVAKYSAERAQQGVRGAAVGATEALFLGKTKESKAAMRHAVGEYLFGKASSKDWSHGECQALLDWAQVRNAHGELDPSETAAKEAAAILELMARGAGQQELPL